MGIAEIINIVFIVIFALYCLFDFLRGLKLGMTKCIIKLVLLVLAAVFAVIVTRLTLSIASGYLMGMVKSIESIAATLTELFDASPTLEAYLGGLVVGLVGPLVFLIFFLIISLLFKLFGLVLNSAFEKMTIKSQKANKLLGGAVGVLCGLVAASCVLMPFSGYINLVSSVSTTMETNNINIGDSNSGATEILDTVSTANNKFIVRASSTTTGFLFNATSEVAYENHKTNAVDEINTIIVLVPEITNLQTMNFDDIGNIDLTPIDNLIAKLDTSDSLKKIIAEIISTAAGNWKNGETFMGIDLRSQIPSDYVSALDVVLAKLESTDETNVIDNLNTFSQFVKSAAKVVKLADTLTQMQESVDSGKTKEEVLQEITESVDELLETITPETAEIISEVITPEIIQSAGVSEGASTVIANVLTDSLTTIAGMDEEQKAKESEAISNIMAFVSGSQTVGIENADEIVAAVLDSEAIIAAIQTTVSAESQEALDISPEERQSIIDAVQKYETENVVSAEKQQQIDDLKALFGIE